MSQKPDISVIIPVFNASRTLQCTVNSVCNQSLENWELILVNDGSSDTSLDLCYGLASADTRIRVIDQSNRGPSAARNAGAAQARADVLAFLDADDFWSSVRLEAMLKSLRYHVRAGILFSRTRFVSNQGRRISDPTPFVGRLDPVRLLSENPTCTTSNIMIRKNVFDAVGGFETSMRYAEDHDLVLRVAVSGWTVEEVDGDWLAYRMGAGGLSHDLDRMEMGWRNVITRASRYAPKLVGPNARSAAAAFYRQQARRALREGGSPIRALRELIRAIATDPRIIVQMPRRTALTAAGVMAAFLPVPKLKEMLR